MFLSRYRRVVLVGILIVFLVCVSAYLYHRSRDVSDVVHEIPVLEESASTTPTEIAHIRTTIGTSVEGRAIEAYTFGSGGTHLVFVGGIHGGYEWNSVVLAYEAITYLTSNPTIIPDSLRVTVIPSANPDGVYTVVGKEGPFTVSDVPKEVGPLGTGRFNARGVDLNRNFDCKWKSESMWRGNVVSAGTSAFSEPEAVVLRDFLLAEKPVGVVFWHSQANAVYASECTEGVLPQTLTLMQTYSKAAGYTAIPTFDSYEVTGDAEGWLASIQIPAITVELKTHESIEWEKNLLGLKAVINYYGR